MSERDKKGPVTSEEWGTYIGEYASRWEFGSSEYCAVNDFHNLQRIYGEIGDDTHSDLAQVNGEANLTPEDRLGLILKRIALLEHTIEQNGGRIPGYASAYLEMTNSFLALVDAAANEARTKYSNQDEKQLAYTKDAYQIALDYVADSVFEKQNSR